MTTYLYNILLSAVCLFLCIEFGKTSPCCLRVELFQNCPRRDGGNWSEEVFISVTGPENYKREQHTLAVNSSTSSVMVCPGGSGMYTFSCEKSTESNSSESEVFWSIQLKAQTLLGTVHTTYYMHFDQPQQEWFLITSMHAIASQPICHQASLTRHSIDHGSALARSLSKVPVANSSCATVSLFENCGLSAWCGAVLVMQRQSNVVKSNKADIIYKPRPGVHSTVFDICPDGQINVNLTLTVKATNATTCSTGEVYQSVFWVLVIGSESVMGGVATAVTLHFGNGVVGDDSNTVVSGPIGKEIDPPVSDINYSSILTRVTVQDALTAQPICSGSAAFALAKASGVRNSYDVDVSKIAPPARVMVADITAASTTTATPVSATITTATETTTTILHNPDRADNKEPPLPRFLTVNIDLYDVPGSEYDDYVYSLYMSGVSVGRQHNTIITPMMYYMKLDSSIGKCPARVPMSILSSGGGVLSPPAMHLHTKAGDAIKQEFTLRVFRTGCVYLALPAALPEEGSLALIWRVKEPLVETRINNGELELQAVLFSVALNKEQIAQQPNPPYEDSLTSVKRRLDPTSWSDQNKFISYVGSGGLDLGAAIGLVGIGLLVITIVRVRRIIYTTPNEPKAELTRTNQSFIYDMKEAQELLRSLSSNDDGTYSRGGRISHSTTVEVVGNSVTTDKKTEVTIESWGGTKAAIRTLPDGSMVFKSSSTDAHNELRRSRSYSLDSDLARGQLANNIFDIVLRTASTGSTEGDWLEAHLKDGMTSGELIEAAGGTNITVPSTHTATNATLPTQPETEPPPSTPPSITSTPETQQPPRALEDSTNKKDDQWTDTAATVFI